MPMESKIHVSKDGASGCWNRKLVFPTKLVFPFSWLKFCDIGIYGAFTLYVVISIAVVLSY
jgi:hypothetical protein